MEDWSKKYEYYLFKFQVYDTNFLIMHRSELPALGFSSLYAITKEDAEALVSASTSVQFKGSVWSQTLAIDVDDEEVALVVENRLSEMKLDFTVYSTGNRGKHFYITRPHSPSHILPQIDKEWIKEHFPSCDTSIYSNLHLFRLPGAIHDKTGNRKKLLCSYKGIPLILPDHLTQNDHILYKSGKDVTQSIFLDQWVMSQTVPWQDGKRHEALLNLGVKLRKNGEPIEFIERWLYHANLLHTPPKPQEELDRIIQFVSEVDVD